MHQALLPTKVFFPNVKTQLYRLKSMLCYKNTLLYFSHKNICFFDIRIMSFFITTSLLFLAKKSRILCEKIAHLIVQTKYKAKLSSMNSWKNSVEHQFICML